MNSPAAQREIDESVSMGQPEYDVRHFEAWFAEEQVRQNNLLKEEEGTERKAFFAGMTLGRELGRK
ncbi:MAG: hypothetical protein ACOYMN_18455 [Roseimicrobium sp.]